MGEWLLQIAFHEDQEVFLQSQSSSYQSKQEETIGKFEWEFED